MYALVYRWRLRAGRERDFIAAWESMTASIRRQCGSYGSRLHRCEDGTWVAYARWPDAATQAACAPDDQAAAAAMAEAIAERFEPLRLAVVSDLLDEPIASDSQVVSVTRDIAATPETIFELIADPAQQPRWDGNTNLAHATDGQRVRAAGEVFTMTLTGGSVRENHVVEFVEARRIAWRPAEPGAQPPGHLWRWELEPLDAKRTRVSHTYDWSELHDATRLGRARATTPDRLRASIDRLTAIAEAS